ncbi:hypothetical protein ANCCAN_05595 [Ancylostoma caninum]|uniref:Uncharacterized protein n=1 Tax=Ancylostoma caninum TaxID=29170 RepID=A0A368GVA8_ANCCA|nr:hypothetical protein ANCCAN_05595 [Ancylostoma caninum]
MNGGGGGSSSGGGGVSAGGSSSASVRGRSASARSRSSSIMGSVPAGGMLSEMGSTSGGTITVDIEGRGDYVTGGGRDIMVSPIMVTTFIRGIGARRRRNSDDHVDNGNHFGQIGRI